MSKYCIIALIQSVICRSFDQNVNEQSTLISFAPMLLYAGSNVCYSRAREFTNGSYGRGALIAGALVAGFDCIGMYADGRICAPSIRQRARQLMH